MVVGRSNTIGGLRADVSSRPVLDYAIVNFGAPRLTPAPGDIMICSPPATLATLQRDWKFTCSV